MRVFDLPERLAAKDDPALIGADEEHFAAIAASLERTVAELTERLAAERAAPVSAGQAALDRDLEVHRLTARLRTLRRYGLDLCLGHLQPADGSERVYVGRLGLTDADGRRLLVDWRSPAAEPFFGATHANPMGLASRRRYRWTRGRITDYWDEVFTPEGLEGHAALDDQSAFLASLGAHRSERMRDVLGTLQADQDAIIRAGSRGALVVDGGPGTGKTVVALHRAAYLVHSDPRLQQQRRGGVLFVGPSVQYLSYVSDVLPSLGEEGVLVATLNDLVPEGASAQPEPDPDVARLKAAAAWPKAVDAAVALYEEPPAKPLTVTTPWAEVRLTPEDWVEAIAAADPGTPHNDARTPIWDELVTIVVDKHREVLEEEDLAEDQLRRFLGQHRELVAAFHRTWPLLEAADIVADLWAVPAYLRRCAPWLSVEEVRRLQRPEGSPWTVADLPLLDAARQRLGDPEAARRRRANAAELALEREQRSAVIDRMIEADHDHDSLMWMFRDVGGQDMREVLVEDSVLALDVDAYAGPFAHVVVDEAQELTDAQWQMLLARCPSRSFTIVGDRAQARHGFPETWEERLHRVGLDTVRVTTLTVNYRTPTEVMAKAEPVIRAVLPDANVPTSIRSSGIPVTVGATADLPAILDDWLAANPEGVAAVIGAPDLPDLPDRPRVASLTPESAKGLEFDLVVLVDPDEFGTGVSGAVDRYVAMTRATRQLVLLAS